MRKTFLIASGLVLAGIVGCKGPQTDDQLQARYTAADQIQDEANHDDALMGVAADAANSKKPSMCLNAVSDIKDRGKQDRTANDCADTFNKNGDRDTAMQLANKINDPSLKDKVLRGYANGAAPVPTTMPMMSH